MTSKSRRFLAVLGLFVLLVGGYLSWQVYQGQQLANQYATEAQKLAQGSSPNSAAPNSQTPGSSNSTLTPGDPAAPPQTSPAQVPSALNPASPGSPSDPGVPLSPSPNANAENYKQLMTNTYQETLKTMQNVKSNTLTFQGRNLSISAYKASIVQSQAAFSAAEAYVRANPPTDQTLNPSYYEFLAGITLAKQSMDVVLKGISSLSAANFYAAREMGKKAQQQVVAGYSRL